MKSYLKLEGCQPRIPELQFRKPIDWTLREGEYWAVIGDNGSGKSVLADMIRGRYALKAGRIAYGFAKGTSDFKVWESVRLLSFDSVYGLADFRNSYYQQRWHSSENDDMPAVEELLGEAPDPAVTGLLGVDAFRDKKINYLSSGELRKFLITKALLDKPRLLIVDNPYVGLDALSRTAVKESLRNLCRCGDMQVIFLFSAADDLPDFITHVLPMHDLEAGEPMDFEAFQAGYPEKPLETLGPAPEAKRETEPVVELKNIRIRYGRKTVLENIDWIVRRGEKWALSGPNGSGKSTLLSLVNADHPQAYANDISFFGRRRGAGQSIWDVKKRIGYVSPEMHTHYYQNIPAADVVGSGLFDTIGTVRQCDEAQAARCMEWMERFGIAHLRDRSFIKLSSGEQRLVLLARTFVKEPPLLILDEPLHGLDLKHKRAVRSLIDDYCTEDVTLIYVTHYLNELPGCIDRHFRLEKRKD